MNSSEEPETPKERIYSYTGAGDSILPRVGATNVKWKRAGLPWVFVVVFLAVLCVLVAPLKPLTIWPTSLPITGTVACAIRQEIVEGPTVTTDLTGNGRTNDVLWDKYSLVLKGQRIFIQYVRL